MDFGLWMSDFGLWISDVGLRMSDVGLWISDVGLRISGVGLRISGVGLRMSTGYTGCGGSSTYSMSAPFRGAPPSEHSYLPDVRAGAWPGTRWHLGRGIWVWRRGESGHTWRTQKKLSYLTVGPLGTTPRGAEGAEAPPGSPLRRGRSSARRWAPVPGGAPAPSRRPAPRRPPASTAATAADRRRASERPSSSDSASPPAPPGCS